jgi:hypothetical protein
MASTRITLEDIQAWATQHFPDDSKHLPDGSEFGLQMNTVSGYNRNKPFKNLVIGTTHNKAGRAANVVAWLQRRKIKIAYIGKDHGRTGQKQIRLLTSPEDKPMPGELKWPF